MTGALLIVAIAGLSVSYFVGWMLRGTSGWAVIATMFIAVVVGFLMIFFHAFVIEAFNNWLLMLIGSDDLSTHFNILIWGIPAFWVTMLISKLMRE